jgi:hypothetical protein
MGNQESPNIQLLVELAQLIHVRFSKEQQQGDIRENIFHAANY